MQALRIGETFEECVKGSLRRLNQGKEYKVLWVPTLAFPNSMMIGFTAEYLEGEIRVDREEVLDTDYFPRKNRKCMKSISLGSQLIEWF